MKKRGRTYIPKCEDQLPLPQGQRPCPRCLRVLATDNAELKKARRKKKCTGPRPVEPPPAPSPSPEKPAVTRAGGDPSRAVKCIPYNANPAENPMRYTEEAQNTASRRHRATLQAISSPRTSTGDSKQTCIEYYTPLPRFSTCRPTWCASPATPCPSWGGSIFYFFGLSQETG